MHFSCPFPQNSAFPQNFHTRKLGEITYFHSDTVDVVLTWQIFIQSFYFLKQ